VALRRHSRGASDTLAALMLDPSDQPAATSRKPRLPAALMAGVLIALLLLPAACSDPDDLSDGSITLPPSLLELSGMVAFDKDTLACVQDELGVVFLVDLNGKKPVRSVPFGKKGDYEGIAVSDGTIWVLRSDGTLKQLAWKGDRLKVKHSYKLPFDGEFEGLCADAKGEHLLVLPKGPVDGKRREKARRRILGFHLLLRTSLPKPVMTLKVDEIEKQIEARDLPAPRRTTAKGKRKVELRLYGSELLALPGGDLLMLAPKDRLLLRIDPDGNVVATQALDMDLLPQPEAMALLPDGRLLIGSEGRDLPARIAVVPIPK
tara:strand:+ start:17439 stop:18395 length:957 start_codon:yes stop_codon:yes gene_type:complete